MANDRQKVQNQQVANILWSENVLNFFLNEMFDFLLSLPSILILSHFQKIC